MKTKKFERVLIALDYDETTPNAADAGFSLARSMGTRVMIRLRRRLKTVALPNPFSGPQERERLTLS